MTMNTTFRGRTILEQCIPPGSPETLFTSGEMCGRAKTYTELLQELPAAWINHHGHDKHAVGLWILMTIADIREGKR